MTTFLILRHGYSVSNEMGTLTGQLDVPLTPLGVKQGELATQYIAAHHKVDAIVSSDLCRAVDTVKPLARLTGLPIIRDSDLREMSCGVWEGERIATLVATHGAHYTAWSDVSGTIVPEGGEAWQLVGRRMLHALLRIAEAYAGKTVVIATHGGAITALRGTYFGLPLSEWKEKLPFAPNASLVVTEYDQGVFRERGITDEYLGALKTEMPKGI